MMPLTYDIASVKHHYKTQWQGSLDACSWASGPTKDLPDGFSIAVVHPGPERSMWTYATCGMSIDVAMDEPIELHLFSPVETEDHLELLTAIAHYHRTGCQLGLGHTINFGRPWLPGSTCDHGLISLPYLDGPKLEWLTTNGRKIRCLWLFPITKAEAEYKKEKGLHLLEERLEQTNFNYLDPMRPSVV